MKKIVYTLIFTALTVAQAFAQTDLPVVVGGAQKGEVNATMEILSKGGKKGFMPPRLTTAQVTTLTTNLTAASEGLTVFNIDTDCLQYWKGTKWSDCSTYSSAEVAFDCSASSIKGIYNVDKVVTDNEFLEIKVNVTRSGPFMFYTEAKNGVRFYLSTILEVGANQVISVPAIGTPKAAGTFTYNLFDQSGNPICPGNAAFTTTVVVNKADFDIKCTESFVSGAFYDNLAVNDQKMVVKIATHAAGNYYIKTDVVNGLWFEGSGTINFGTTEILLDAKGIATVAATGDTGLRTFNLFDRAGNSLGCSVTTSIMASKADFTVDCATAKLLGFDDEVPVFTPDYVFRDTDKLTVSINVTRTGPISLTTDPSTPAAYSYVGTIEKPGVQTITLTPTRASINYHGPWDSTRSDKYFTLKFFNYGTEHSCSRQFFYMVWDYIAKYTFSNGPVNMYEQGDQDVFDNVKLFVPIEGKKSIAVPAIFTEGGIIRFSGTAAGITIRFTGSGAAPGITTCPAFMTGTLTSTGIISFPMYDELTGDFKGGFIINFKG